MKNSSILLLLAGLFLLTQSCTDKVDTDLYHYTDEEYEVLKEKLDLPLETHNYTVVTNRPVPGFNPDLPFHKATLGRVLFYDKMLSADESTSCASCHKQSAAFADTEKFSEGLDGQIGTRNSLPLGNTIGFVKYYGTDLSIQSGFFSWDESKMSIDEQSSAAIENPIEMGHDMWELTQKIREEEHYKILFSKAYPEGNPIKEANILDAITEFVNSMSSRESKFDKSIDMSNGFGDAYASFEGFTVSENNGKAIFNSNCSSCHGVNHNAIVTSSANNGLDLEYADKGVGAAEGKSYLNGVFKVPSLRNIELTGPYMHDGRFETLEEVVEHYNEGIKDHPNLSASLKDQSNDPKRLNLSTQQKANLVSYLKTLTDQEFVTAEKYADPFK